MADWYKDYMHPYTDRATFIAFQNALRARRIRALTDAEQAVIVLYDALETTGSQLKTLAGKVASIAREEPSVIAMSKHSAMPRR